MKVHRPRSDSKRAVHYCYKVYGLNHEIQIYAVSQCQNTALLVHWYHELRNSNTCRNKYILEISIYLNKLKTRDFDGVRSTYTIYYLYEKKGNRGAYFRNYHDFLKYETFHRSINCSIKQSSKSPRN